MRDLSSEAGDLIYFTRNASPNIATRIFADTDHRLSRL